MSGGKSRKEYWINEKMSGKFDKAKFYSVKHYKKNIRYKGIEPNFSGACEKYGGKHVKYHGYDACIDKNYEPKKKKRKIFEIIKVPKENI